MLTRNKTRATRPPPPPLLKSRQRRERHRWDHQVILSLLDTLSKPEHYKLFTSSPMKFAKNMALRYFNTEDRTQTVYAKLFVLRQKYYQVKAQQLVRRSTGNVLTWQS